MIHNRTTLTKEKCSERLKELLQRKFNDIIFNFLGNGDWICNNYKIHTIKISSNKSIDHHMRSLLIHSKCHKWKQKTPVSHGEQIIHFWEKAVQVVTSLYPPLSLSPSSTTWLTRKACVNEGHYTLYYNCSVIPFAIGYSCFLACTYL